VQMRNNAGVAPVHGVSQRSFVVAAAQGVSEGQRRAQVAVEPVNGGDVGFRFDKKTTDFKVAIDSRQMQRSALTKENISITRAKGSVHINKKKGGRNHLKSYASMSALFCSSR
jgi:hypothetical protein